jgi:uridine phosphorylase
MVRQDAIVNPIDFVKYVAKQRKVNVKEFKLPSIGVITFNSKLLEKFISRFKATHKPWLYRVKIKPICNPYIAAINSKEVVFILPGWGSPRAVGVVEEMIACGVKKFIIVGYCGSLIDKVGLGDLVIPSEAIIDEGTSKHYISDISTSKPSKRLLKMLIKVCDENNVKYHVGKIWTTDAFYRESVDKVLKHLGKGAVCVDMETSALFTLASYRKVKATALHIVSDSLAGLKWKPEMKTNIINSKYKIVVKILDKLIRKM